MGRWEKKITIEVREPHVIEHTATNLPKIIKIFKKAPPPSPSATTTCRAPVRRVSHTEDDDDGDVHREAARGEQKHECDDV